MAAEPLLLACQHIVDFTVRFWVSKVKYITKLGDKLKDLQRALDDLIRARDLVNHVMAKVTVAGGENNLLKQVQSWLKEVQDMQNQIDRVQTRYEEPNNLCLGGLCCKNWKSRYQIGNEVVKLQQEVTNLKNKAGSIKEVAQILRAESAELAVVRNQNISLEGAVLNNNNITVVQQ